MPLKPPDWLLKAQQLLEQGHSTQAARLLQRHGKQPDALHLLGIIAAQQGRWQEAERQLRRALKAAPQTAGFHNSLGNVLLEQGRQQQAASAYRRALQCQPGHPQARFGLGRCLLAAGEWAQAEALLVELARQWPHPLLADALCRLGQARFEQGRYDLSEQHLQAALRLQAGHATALQSLGALYLRQERNSAALPLLQQARALAPEDAHTLYLCGVALRRLQRHQEALQQFQAALQHAPDNADAHTGLGQTFQEMGHYAEAETSLRRALELRPGAYAWNGLASTLLAAGRVLEAEQAAQAALQLEPDFATAYELLGRSRLMQGRGAEALPAYLRALELEPEAQRYSNYLWALTHCETDPQRLFAAHQAYQRDYATALEPLPATAPPSGTRRLRLGYLSADFRRHSVAYFFEPLLAAQDRQRFEVFCYSVHPQQDEITARLRGLAEHWRACAGLDDAALARQIRADGIDILVELGGHTGHNRLPVLARRPAPTQISYLGYPGTTGLNCVDYHLSDVFSSPPGAEAYNSEKLLRLPFAYHCYQPPEAARALAVSAAPVLQSGRLCLASFNSYAKITDATLALWAQVLSVLPEAELLLQNSALNEEAFRVQTRHRCAAAGIDPQRLRLESATGLAEHLRLYAQVDIILDSYPFSGATTTCHALWMGVPVLGLRGATQASRLTYSILASLGLEELSAETPEDWVQLATHWGRNPQALQALRLGLRSRLQQSPLMQNAAFCREFETLLLSTQ